MSYTEQRWAQVSPWAPRNLWVEKEVLLSNSSTIFSLVLQPRELGPKRARTKWKESLVAPTHEKGAHTSRKRTAYPRVDPLAYGLSESCLSRKQSLILSSAIFTLPTTGLWKCVQFYIWEPWRFCILWNPSWTFSMDISSMDFHIVEFTIFSIFFFFLFVFFLLM